MLILFSQYPRTRVLYHRMLARACFFAYSQKQFFFFDFFYYLPNWCQDNYRYTQTPVLHEYPPNVFTLYVVTVDDGGLEAEIDDPNLDKRRSDLRPTVSMLSAINVTHLLMSDNIYQYVHRPDICLGQDSPNVTAMDEIDYTHVIWSVYSNSSNENNVLSTNNLNSSSGIIHMPPVGKDNLIFVPAYKMLR